ncbi:hypothetical protein A2U01_0077670, partial [Trifolium medium]|nr:hypothetical protein [Trifolium medium]
SANDEDNLSADVVVVNVDDIHSEEVSVERTPGPSIAKRLRSRSAKLCHLQVNLLRQQRKQRSLL